MLLSAAAKPWILLTLAIIVAALAAGLLGAATGTQPAVQHTRTVSTAPGDSRQGYEHKGYVSDTHSVTDRQGQRADLLALVKDPPLGLPPVPVPADNPDTKKKIRLGRKLFFDRRLSLTNTQSCAMCHIPEQGFTSNELETAVGFEGRTVKRNAPTMYNVAYQKRLFHDAREFTLRHQIWSPMLHNNEMNNPSIGWVLNKIRHLPDYPQMFQAAFNEGVTMENVGKAIASYSRTLLSANSPFDRWHFGGQADAMSDAAQRGYKLFTGKAHCSNCHLIKSDHALFTDQKLHNTGIGYRASTQPEPAKRQVQLAPGVFVDVDKDIVDSVSRPIPNDVGRYEVTLNPADRWKYKTPSLRNVALTAPYMHNGSLHTLRDVVDFYNKGGVPNKLLDPLIQPLDLSKREEEDLVAFLKSLTGDNVETLVGDAFSAPIGDIRRPHAKGIRESKRAEQ